MTLDSGGSHKDVDVESGSLAVDGDCPRKSADEADEKGMVEGQGTGSRTTLSPVESGSYDSPLAWSRARKTCHQVLIVYMSFSCVFTSSVYYPAIATVDENFFPSEISAILPFSVYILGLASGSLFAAPLSETYGRKSTFLCGVTGAALFTLGAGFANSVAALSVCRYFAGVFFSAEIAVPAGALADIFAPAERAIPFSLASGVAFLGPAMGPIVGGYVAARHGWRWTQWMALVFMAPCFLYAGLRESYLPVIKARHEAQAQKAAAASATARRRNPLPALIAACKQMLSRTLMRPLAMLATEPVVAAFAAYLGFNFGINYAFVAVYPTIFSGVYKLSLTDTGYAFAGLAGGVLLGTAALVALNQFVYKRKLGRARAVHGPTATLPPEQRLYGALCGGPCICAGIFAFGWSARPDVSPVAPAALEALFGAGNLLVYSACSQYIVDHYGAARGASATAANTLVRYLLAFALPLFIGRMYDALGVGWASSLLGFVSAGLALVPWVLFRWGPWLRRQR